MMRKLFAGIALLCAFATASFGQEKKVNYNVYGFFSNYGYYDSHVSLQSNDGIFNIMPTDRALDAEGRDINAVGATRLLSITTRLGVDITPDEEVFDALPLIKIETDFCGYSGSVTMLRIRQAFLKLNWDFCSALLGQTWHPMAGDLKPDVFSLGTGSPFNPFNRSPQIRFDYRPNDCLTASAAAIWQFQYSSVGMNGTTSPNMSRKAIVPELYAGINYVMDNYSFGAGADFLTIKPTDNVLDAEGGIHKVNSHCPGLNLLAQGCYMLDELTLKGKVVYGQNTSHLLQPSGYGVTYSDGKTISFAPLHNVSSWITATYGEELKYCMMLGYFKNLGSAGDDFIGNVVMYGNHAGCPSALDNLFRVNPFVTYRIGPMTLCAEYEWTCAAYGTMYRSGRVSDTHPVSNHRVGFLVKYEF